MKHPRQFYLLFVLTLALVLPFNWRFVQNISAGYARHVLSQTAPVTPEDGDWAAKTTTLTGTPEADLMARTGDIDNLNFGWPSGFNPFSGNSTPVHSFPWTVDPNDPAGTDRIMVITSYTGNPPSGQDGYTSTTSRPANNVQSIVLSYNLGGISVTSARLQMFVDDFQAPVWRASYQVTINGVRAQFLEDLINSLNQTGPIGKLISVQVPPSYLNLVASGQLTINIDDKATGAGDGYAIDFVKLLVNPKAAAQKGTITGTVTSSATQQPLAGATVSAGGIVEVQTGSDGRYTLNDVPAGLVLVKASKSSYASKTASVDLIAGQTATVNFALDQAPVIEVTPASLDFGTVSSGQNKTLDLTVRNTGAGPLSVTTITSDNPVFSVTSATSFTVPAGQQQTVSVRFAPTSSSPQTGTLTINNNDPNRPAVTVPLSGNGGANCTYTLSPTSQNFPASGGTGSVNVTAQRGTIASQGEATRAVTAFSPGDVFASVGKGIVKRFSPAGALLQTLDSVSGANEGDGMAFDTAGNLYATQGFTANKVVKFDLNGTLLGLFGSGYNIHPESIAIDLAQNIYIGQPDGSRQVLKFNSAGTLLDTFSPTIESRGTDWIELAADQRTLFYTSEGKTIKRYDLQTKAQLANFNQAALPGSYAFALRILPGGGVIVADWESIIRLDASGNNVQTYDAPGEDKWFAVNLDPDGQTFWSANYNTGQVYRFNIATGAVVANWNAGPLSVLGGITVFGEITAAQVLRVSKTAPATVAPGAQLTYTLSYGNTGTANAANVVIRDTVPTGTTFVSATDGGVFSNGVVTWNIGALNAGVTGRTVSFTVSVSGSLSGGTIINNNNYTIEATSVTPVQGTPVTTTVTGSACNWTATSNAPWITVTSGTPGADNGTVGYAVAPSTGPARTGTITIAGLTFTVTQDAGSPGCTWSIAPTSQSFAAGGGTGSVNVTTQAGCAWTATSNVAWITVTSGTPGQGSGAISYAVAGNSSTDSRTGTITIAGLTFTVTQSGTGASGPLIRIVPTTLDFNLPKPPASSADQTNAAQSGQTRTDTTRAQAADKTGQREPRVLPRPENEHEPEGELRRDFQEWFYQQREYPQGQIPEGALRRAWTYQQERARELAAAEEAAAISPTQWSFIGPAQTTGGRWNNVGGRVSSIIVHPNNPNTVFVGGAQGGVWRTTDNGASWTPLTDNQVSLAMGALAFDPTNPNIIYAGTGEQHFSLDSYYGNGVLKTTDGGASWNLLGADVFVRQTISRVLVSQGNSQVVFAAADRGLYRSTNGGANWTRVLAGSTSTATDIVAAPGASNTLYAGIYSDGVYKSTDGGANWTKLTAGLPAINIRRVHLAISGSSPNTLLAVFADGASRMEGLYRTTDGGASWTRLGNTPEVFGGQGFYNISLAIHPANPNVYFLGGVMLWRSVDGGATWANVSNPNGYQRDVHPDQHAIAFNPQNPSVVWLGCDGGVWRSDNGGDAWVNCNNGLGIMQFQSVGLHPTDDRIAYGGTQDNGTQRYSGNETWREIFGGDGGTTIVDFSNPTTVFTTYIYGNMARSSDSGNNWVAATGGIPISDGRADTRVGFYAPFTMDPSNSQRLAFGSYRVWYTTSSGDNWTNISGDLGGGGLISAITIAANGSRIWAGTSDARVWRGDFSGGSWNWTNLNKAPLPGRYVTRIAAHPTDVQTAYVSFSGFDTDHVFRTTDGGATWTSASAGLPNIPVNVVLVDPNNANTVYAGTDLGVYRSTDQGQSWALYGTNLPNVAIFDMAVNKISGALRVATHGRGMWEIQTGGEQGFTIFNDGGSPLRITGITKQNNSAWLTFTPPAPIPFDIAPGSSVRVRVSVNATGLNAGNYSDRLLVTSNDTPRSPYPDGVFVNLTIFGNTGCQYAISPTSQTVNASGGNGSVNVTAPGGCAWTAASNDAWITITSGASGNGNGTLNFSVAANPGSQRTGTITIAGETFTVTQPGGSNCTFNVAPTSQSFGASGGTGSIGVTTQSGCNWAAVSNAAWITITAGASGTSNGQVSYVVAANNSPNPRTGTMTVAGQTVTITQSGGSSCTFALSPTAQSFTDQGGSGSVTVLTQSDCRWTAVSNVAWVTIIGGSNGSGGGTVSYVVANNISGQARAGTLTIAGLTFTITQSATGGGCIIIQISIGQTVNGALTTSDCWSPIDGEPFYADRYSFYAAAGQQVAILLTSPDFDSFLYLIAPDGALIASDDDGGGGLNSRIPENSGYFTLPVSGTYLIEVGTAFDSQTGNYTLSLTAPGGCTFTLSPDSRSFDSSGGTDSVNVSTQSGCLWTATSNASWIVITSGSSGQGSGTVGYAVSANNTANARTGTLTIAGQTVTITQSGGSSCTFALSPASQSFGSSGGTNSVNVTTQSGCNWTALSNVAWITVTAGASGSSSGTVGYSVAANNGGPRTGTITIAGQNFTVSQDGSSNCTFSISPTSKSFGAGGGNDSVAVTAPGGCVWTAASNVAWITLAIGSSTGSGNGSVSFTVAANAGNARTGTITIAGLTFTVNQSSAAGACPTVSGISPSSGPVGSSVVITGTNLTGVTVKFGGNVTATINGGSDTSLTVTVPAGAITGPITISKAGCNDVQTSTFTVTADASCLTPPSGVMGWWPGDGNASDLTGAHNGTLKNGATYATGFVSQAFQLDGVDDYVDLGGFAPGSQWTLEAWVKPSSVPTGRRAILGGVNSCADWALVLQDGRFGLAIKPASGACTDTLSSGVAAVAGAWYHLVGTSDGTTARIYVNGELKGSAQVASGYTGTTSGTYIGGDSCCTEFFPGLIDEATIYNRALSGTEAQAIYNVGSAGKCRTVSPCPTVSGINPTSGAIGSTVTITGANFTSVSAVKFANNVTAQFTINSDTQITATVPAGAVTGPITISKAGCNDVQTGTFTVTAPPACPTVSGINPASGAVGSSVTITGANLTGVTVKFASNVAATITASSDTSLTVTVPNGAVTGPITISKAGCNDVQTGTFTVTTGPCITVSISGTLTGSSGSGVTIPVMASDTTGQGALSYDFTLTYDPAVLRLQSTPFDKTGTLSSAMTITTNTGTPGQLRLSAFGTSPLVGGGTLLNLKFDLIGAVSTCSNLTWTSFRFNEGTPCSTTSNGRICAVGGSISGQVSYCIAPKAVPGVQMTAAGTPQMTAVTNSAGTYQLTGLGGGAYTLTPAKTGDANGITSFDAAQVAQHVVGLITLSQCQQAAGDTSGDGSLSSFDAALIAQYVVGISNPVNKAGTWKFIPPNRSYPSLSGEMTSQNFDAVLVGDVSGNWVPGAAIAPSRHYTFTTDSASVIAQTTVSLPSITATPGTNISIPITIGDLTGKNIIAYDFDLTFDANLLQPLAVPVDAAGTISAAMTITPNATTGRLRVSAFGTSALSGAGTLLKLSFRVIGSDASGALAWQKFVLNEETLSQGSLTNGTVAVLRLVTSVSAANYGGPDLAAESILAAFGVGLATRVQGAETIPLPTMLAGTTVKVRDSAGNERLAPLFFVSPNQVNYQLPAGTVAGQAIITITSGDGAVSGGALNIITVAPSVFTADSSGSGLAAAYFIRVKQDNSQSLEFIFRYDTTQNKFVAIPVEFTAETQKIVLVLFGTGWRGRSALSAVGVKFGGLEMPVEYAGPQGGYVGLDQMNVELMRTLAGRGEIDIAVTVDGKAATLVKINMK